MTYAESAHRREVQARRRAQDARDRTQHAIFDLQAQDKHHKHDRPSFIVGGEGSARANANYLRGYTRIFGGAHGPR